MRPLQADGHDRWRELYAGYAAFYGLTPTAEQAERTWTWLMDPARELEGLVAHGVDGHLVGIAHVRAFARPSTATIGGYLDDLYVDPHARGTGVAPCPARRCEGRRATCGSSGTTRRTTSPELTGRDSGQFGSSAGPLGLGKT